MRKLLIFILLLAAIGGAAIYAGLANPLIERRVKSALVENGIGEKRAECMAGRMVDRLTIAQLIGLQNMRAQEGETENPTGVGDFIKRVRRIGDTEAVAVVASSAGLCAIGIG
ncbi:hypothetical protein GCM10023115_22760 [Pontixanthobacter gangjinensis]|uniref:Uncharacterized protein n=1 Tax=Pontixanthobacter gangjinensis TaxID=1028742 RepID=A0A6I4SPE7_9SPHN|nr:hypothetical protein [Pontixanthobacter gangjinensis]MXO57519.1 hypothetical protein [Pontixanthobacter gangjinensis]